jgi:hypothetical protein
MPRPKTSVAALSASGLTLVVALMLAGCGQVRASGSASRPSRSDTGQSSASRSRGAAVVGKLCARPAIVTAVRVIRTPSLAQMGGTKPLGRDIPAIVVADPGKARALARVICSLPTMPHAIWQCPIDVGGGYALEFMSGRWQFPPVTIQASGCEPVTGTGPGRARWVARTPGFWTAFSQLTGVQAAAHSPVITGLKTG